MNTNKVGLHVAANCGGCGGIDAYWRRLDEAGIPFTVYSANDAGLLVAAAKHSRATLVYRDVVASTVDPSDYSRNPATTGYAYWEATKLKLPNSIKGLSERYWIELLNEPGREPEQADWVGWLMFHMAGYALKEGYRVMGPGWAPGNPEPEAWESAGWRAYLELCAANRDRAAVSLHEYALDNDIHHGEPWLIGRFRQLYLACGRMGVRVPRIFITECGWTLNSMPPNAQAKDDIDYLARMYADYPEIVSAHLWTLQSGRGNGYLPQRLNALLPWLTEYTLTMRFPDVEPEEPTEPLPVSNQLFNPSFEDGWTDADTFPGQHPKGWRVEWNMGEGYDNPHSEWPYQLGEGVHKSSAMLPASERTTYIWDGEWTYKLFAGQRCFWARLKQAVELTPGRYRLATPVWVDCYRWVGKKDYAVEPWQAERMVKVNGVTVQPWSLMVSGTRSPNVTEFDHAGGVCELAIHFRCNWPISNNLWLDGWSLEAVTVAEPPPPGKHKAIVVKLPQDMSEEEWLAAAKYAFGFRHTMTASHDDMMTALRGGSAESYVKLAYPERQRDVEELVRAAGYGVAPIFETKPAEFRLANPLPMSPLYVNSPFNHPRDYGLHEGIDLAAKLGNMVVAACGGVVESVRSTDPGTGYGKYVRVRSEVDTVTWKVWYAHLDRISVTVGKVLKTGDEIGFAGSSGNSTGPHLHLTVQRIPGGASGYAVDSVVDPAPLLGLAASSLPGLEIDLLPYLRGDGRLYDVRHASGATETFQTQSGSGNVFYQVKNAQWEELSVDETYIWRGTDTSPGPDSQGVQRFYRQWEADKPMARWCLRRMSVGQEFVAAQPHNVQFYRKDDCRPLKENSGIATNRIKLIARHGSVTWGSLVINDVLELRSPHETYYYARGHGLVAWGANWGTSHIVRVYQRGDRADLVREKLNCS